MTCLLLLNKVDEVKGNAKKKRPVNGRLGRTTFDDVESVKRGNYIGTTMELHYEMMR